MNLLPESIIIFFSNISNAQTLSIFLAMWFYRILCVWETSVWTHLVLNFGCREFISWFGPGRVQVIGAWMSAIVVWLPSLCLCTSETELYFGWSSILCQCAFACGVHWGELSEWYYWCTSDFYGHLWMGVRLWGTSVIFLLHDWIVSLSSYVKNSWWPSVCVDFEGIG